jgi:hypothetical protein
MGAEFVGQGTFRREVEQAHFAAGKDPGTTAEIEQNGAVALERSALRAPGIRASGPAKCLKPLATPATTGTEDHSRVGRHRISIDRSLTAAHPQASSAIGRREMSLKAISYQLFVASESAMADP